MNLSIEWRGYEKMSMYGSLVIWKDMRKLVVGRFFLMKNVNFFEYTVGWWKFQAWYCLLFFFSCFWNSMQSVIWNSLWVFTLNTWRSCKSAIGHRTFSSIWLRCTTGSNNLFLIPWWTKTTISDQQVSRPRSCYFLACIRGVKEGKQRMENSNL